jgi:type IV secretion system protein VirD4
VRTRPTPQGQTGLAEAAGFAALTALAGGLGVLWLWAGLAGLLFGDGWPHGLNLAEHARVAFTLPSHLGDPRAAWPAPVRPALPSAPGFYAVLAAMLAAAAALVAALLAGARRLGLWPPPHPASRSSRWARAGDVRRLVVRAPSPGRLVLGRVAGRLVAAEQRHSVIVIAPTQSGKTTGLAVPAVLEWEGPVLACSVKTDLLRDTLARRARLGEVKVFDPTDITGFPRAGWSPLGASHTWQAARETADRLVASAQPAHGSGEANFWNQAGARYLAPLLFAAASTHRTMVDVVRWVDTDDQEHITNALGGELWEQPRTPDARDERAALETLDGIWRSDDRLRSSLVMTAALALKAYADPTVQECSREGELTADWLLDGSANTAYLCATVTDQARLRPLFVTLIDEITSEVYTRSARTGQPINPPLLVVLDEAANIAPLPDLDQLASTGAGQGIQLVTVVQDLEQMRARWPQRAETILNNHRAKIIGAGISCPATLHHVTRILGDQEICQSSISTSHGEHGRHATTESSTWRALAPANVLREGHPGTAVLIYDNLPPAALQLRPWYADRHLKQLATPPAR